jgi:hypothetical protein
MLVAALNYNKQVSIHHVAMCARVDTRTATAASQFTARKCFFLLLRLHSSNVDTATFANNIGSDGT